MKRRKIMIIGSTWEQEPLFIDAKKKNLYIIATNSHPDGEAFKYADERHVMDPRDLVGLDKLFNKVLPDAVIADACDYSMFAVAFLANKYNLPGPKMDSLVVTNNKYLQRRYGEKIKIPQPKYRLCMTYKEAEDAAEEIGFPLILKPLDNRGSIGVCRIGSKSNLRLHYLETMANSHSRQVLVEQLVPGHVVSLDGIYAEKFHSTVFATKKMHPKFPDNAMHLQFPGNLQRSVVERLHIHNLQLSEVIGIDYGLTHTEFIVNDEDVYFLEIANRGGGVHISNKIVPEITGIDVCDILIRSSFGEKASIDQFDPFEYRAYALLHFFDFGEGRVKRIQGIEEANHIKGVLSLKLNIKAGDYLGDIKTAVNRPGFTIVAAESLAKCNIILKEVYSVLNVQLINKN